MAGEVEQRTSAAFATKNCNIPRHHCRELPQSPCRPQLLDLPEALAPWTWSHPSTLGVRNIAPRTPVPVSPQPLCLRNDTHHKVCAHALVLAPTSTTTHVPTCPLDQVHTAAAHTNPWDQVPAPGACTPTRPPVPKACPLHTAYPRWIPMHFLMWIQTWSHHSPSPPANVLVPTHERSFPI